MTPQPVFKKRITLLIADDHKLIRETMGTMLDADPRFEVISLCKDGEQAVKMAAYFKPDIVLIDINMPILDGYQATQKIRQCSPSTRIVCVSMHSDPSTTNRMMEAGASGYVTKKSSHTTLARAIMDVHEGHRFLCAEIGDWTSKAGNGLDCLTKREMTIVSLVKEGLSSKEIGHELSLSKKTIDVHRYNILRKLNLPNVASLVNYANQQNFSLQ